MGIVFGAVGWFFVRYVLRGFYTVDQSERAVKTSWGRAVSGSRGRGKRRSTFRSPGVVPRRREEERYRYPQVAGHPARGPLLQVAVGEGHKVSVATQTVNMAYDPETPSANQGGTVLEAVTKDQLNTGPQRTDSLPRLRAELYAYLFGVKQPIAHVMGYFVSILRERIANFESPPPPRRRQHAEAAAATVAPAISINDLRKNLRDLNEHMDRECLSSAAVMEWCSTPR